MYVICLFHFFVMFVCYVCFVCLGLLRVVVPTCCPASPRPSSTTSADRAGGLHSILAGGGLLVILGKWMDQQLRPPSPSSCTPVSFRAIREHGSFQVICPQGLSLIWHMFPKPSGIWVISAMCPS